MPDSTPKTLTCPACGAPLNYDSRSATVRCSFCQNVIVLDTIKPEAKEKSQLARPVNLPGDILELVRSGNKIGAIKRYREIYDVSQARAKYAIKQIEAGNLQDPEAGFPTREAAPRSSTTASRSATAPGAWLGRAIPGFIILLVGSIIGFVMLQPGGPFILRLIAMDQSIIIPATQDAAPDVISLFYNTNEETQLLGRVSRADGKLAWKTDPLPGDGHVDDMASDGERVYAVVGADLLAFNVTDGRPAWKTALPDKLDAGDDNLIVQDGMVIVMTMDRSIQAYEATTGKEAWSRPLLSYARGLRFMDKRLVILDYVAGGHDFNIFLLDPADGSEDRVIFPSCKSESSWEETLKDESGIVHDDTTGALYLFFGSSSGCIQRYDLGGGSLTWQTPSDEPFNTTFYGFNYFQSPATIYFGIESHLYALDKQSGTLHLVLQDDAYEMAPLALSGDTLLTLAHRTKGSERFELWGLDSASGKRTWQLIPENSRPIDPPYEMSGLIDNGESGWTWKLTPNGLLLIQFQAEPHQLLLTTYDPTNGSKLDEKTIPLKDVIGRFYSVPSVIGWYDSQVYFTLDGKVYVLDVASMQWILKYQ